MSSKVILTIDDCFTEKSSKMLDFLKSKNIGAILFCIGERMAKLHPTGIQAIRDGFVIGNHSYTHPIFAQRSPQEQNREIVQTEVLIQQAYRDAGINRPKKLFRFPYGMDSFCGRNLVRHHGFKFPNSGNQKYWTWHAELLDGHPIPVNEIDDHVSKCVLKAKTYKRTNAIVLGHDCPANIDNGVFEKLYETTIKNGMSFMTVKEMDAFLKSFS